MEKQTSIFLQHLDWIFSYLLTVLFIISWLENFVSGRNFLNGIKQMEIVGTRVELWVKMCAITESTI